MASAPQYSSGSAQCQGVDLSAKPEIRTIRRNMRFAVDDAPLRAGLVALADQLELWPIDRLRPYERNPRTHSDAQVDQIAASMVEFGWTNPILVDENAGILR
jgi:ParB/Sulfiredoxin domain